MYCRKAKEREKEQRSCNYVRKQRKLVRWAIEIVDDQTKVKGGARAQSL